jgi:hypothetical protein
LGTPFLSLPLSLSLSLSFILDVDYRLCITWIIHQQLWGYKVEEKLRLVVHEQKRIEYYWSRLCVGRSKDRVSIPRSSRDFSSLNTVQTGYGIQPAPQSMGVNQSKLEADNSSTSRT